MFKFLVCYCMYSINIQHIGLGGATWLPLLSALFSQCCPPSLTSALWALPNKALLGWEMCRRDRITSLKKTVERELYLTWQLHNIPLGFIRGHLYPSPPPCLVLSFHCVGYRLSVCCFVPFLKLVVIVCLYLQWILMVPFRLGLITFRI